MEMMYRLWRDERKDYGRQANQRYLRFPMTRVCDSDNLPPHADELRAEQRLCQADACALEHNVILI